MPARRAWAVLVQRLSCGMLSPYQARVFCAKIARCSNQTAHVHVPRSSHVSAVPPYGTCRWLDVPFKRVKGVMSGMWLDTSRRWLYYANTGAGQLRRVDITTGEELLLIKPWLSW